MLMKLSKFLFHWPVMKGLILLIPLAAAGLFYPSYKHLLMPGEVTGVAMHNEPLEGFTSHADFEQSCSHCHAPIHCITDTRCQDCHKEVARQRLEGAGLHSRLPGTDRCQDCHTEHKGRQAIITAFAYSNVDHAALTGFSLARHQKDYDGSYLSCESCHSQDRFANETLDCLSCHAQGDHDYTAQHLEEYGADCLGCHDGYDRMDNWDHAQDYVLDGAHGEVECVDCHAEQVFGGTPRECVGCHEDPEMHAGSFGEDCARCHTTAAWSPAYLTRHTFLLEHGLELEPTAEMEADCQSCHTHSYAVVSCYGCHEHQAEAMVQLHRQAGLNSHQSCGNCHPTGTAEETDQLRAKPEAHSQVGGIAKRVRRSLDTFQVRTKPPGREAVGLWRGVGLPAYELDQPDPVRAP